MKRPLWIALAAAVGIVVGAAVMAVVEEPPRLDATLARTEETVERAPTPEPRERVLLVWTPAGLPADLAGQVSALPRIESSTVVDSDTVNLTGSHTADGRPIDVLARGRVIPLDALAVDPTTYGPFYGKAAQVELGALRPGEALVGETSALLRRAGPGAVLQLANGAEVTVAAVVPDHIVAAAEVVVGRDTAPTLGIVTPRFLLVSYRGDRTSLEQQITSMLPPGVSARFRGPGETPFLRHADAVLPQALIKARFGEFSYTPPTTGRFFEVDAAWRKQNIAAVADAPVLHRRVECHRAVLPALLGALRELEERNLGFLVDPLGYQGCFQPSVVSENGSISRHSWGVAIDLNFAKNPTGAESAVDPRLVEVMERWGLVSGANWLRPDPGHFEYLHPPRS